MADITNQSQNLLLMSLNGGFSIHGSLPLPQDELAFLVNVNASQAQWSRTWLCTPARPLAVFLGRSSSLCLMTIPTSQGCSEGVGGTDESMALSALMKYFPLFPTGPGVQELLVRNTLRGSSLRQDGGHLSLYLKNAGNGESKAGGSGNQEELGETQTKGKNPAKEEAPEYPQEQPRVLETEDFLRCGQMET